jgi:hypothetical protein
MMAWHGLALWLEDHGRSYYRNKKPDSSPADLWVGLQQLVEPGVRHVREVGHGQVQEHGAGRKERLLTCLTNGPFLSS